MKGTNLINRIGLITLFLLSLPSYAFLKVGSDAPVFSLKNQNGKEISLEARRGTWTVLYFYPKASTPGCTKQACAFRDKLPKIRELGAEVFGLSGDGVDDLKKFHAEHRLTFDLLSDPEAKTIENYGTKIPLMKMSKRITYIVNPELKVAFVEEDVDPVLDAEKVISQIELLKSKK